MTENTKAIEQVKNVGLDGGNSGVKIFCEDNAGKEVSLYIPTVVSMYLGDKTENLDPKDVPAEDLEKQIDVTINSKALTFNGSRYIVGKKVLTDHMAATETEENSDKSTDDVVAVVSLAGLAILAMKESPESNNIKVKYDLGLNLPVNDINKKTAKINNERFIGTHEVIFHHPEREVKVTLEIEFANTLPEGASAAWGIVYDKNGKPVVRQVEINDKLEKKSLENEMILHFDIGGNSSEVVVTKGVAFVPKLSNGLTYGVKKTVSQIREIWNHKHNKRTIDSLLEFNEIYLNSEHPRHLELKEMSKNPLIQLAETFSRVIIDKIDGLKDDPYVFIYGGGAEILKTYLIDILTKKKRMKNVIFLEDPLFTNAKGSKVYTDSPRFKKKKEEYLEAVANG